MGWTIAMLVKCEWDEFAIGIVMIPNKLKSICIKFVSNAANTTAEPIEQEYTHIPSNWIKYQIYCTEIRLHSFDKFNQNKSNFIKFIQILNMLFLVYITFNWLVSLTTRPLVLNMGGKVGNPLYFSYDKISANTASSEPRTSKFQKVQNT